MFYLLDYTILLVLFEKYNKTKVLVWHTWNKISITFLYASIANGTNLVMLYLYEYYQHLYASHNITNIGMHHISSTPNRIVYRGSVNGLMHYPFGNWNA
jgi:hypothetical protein